MYVPASFEEPDLSIALDLATTIGFATLVSWPVAGPIITHLPVLVDASTPGRERLLGHVAKANPHASALDGTHPSVAIFQGPHGYVSPAWYARRPSVPTWNYAVVHVHGAPTALDRAATWRVLQDLTARYEAQGTEAWRADSLPTAFVDNLLSEIVGFELPIVHVEAKLKLSQNRHPEDRDGVLMGLERAGDPQSRELAELMRSTWARTAR